MKEQLTKEEALTKIKELEEYIESLDKELKLYDVVKYCNYEWYVIKIEEEYVTLMSKNIIGTCAYSDNNNNDFAESNCIKLLNEFTDQLNIYDLVNMSTNYDEDKQINSLIRIPTLREIETMPMPIRACGSAYWTMTASYGVSEDSDYAVVFYVYSDGRLGNGRVNYEYGVRPVIKLKTDKLL